PGMTIDAIAWTQRRDVSLFAGELAAVCAELGRHAFVLTVAPPRLRGAPDVPVNPLAIFWHVKGRPHPPAGL
ncbi:MAG TPA: hypothetical protein VGE11_08860, partial [Pseudonocardia sp.]